MKLFSFFKRNPWITVYSKYTNARAINIFGRTINIEAKLILEVKQRKDGAYKYQCYLTNISGDVLQNVQLDYVLSKVGSEDFRNVLQKYNLI